MITIVDYGVGNLGSIGNMLHRIGAQSSVATAPDQIRLATKIILPGVGAFDAGMSNLRDRGLIESLDEAVRVREVPVLGICLGMQLMTRGSEEGELPGLGWVDAQTIRFRPADGEVMRVPHMGWGTVRPAKSHVLCDGLDDQSRYYFVHSYHAVCSNDSDVLLRCRYGSADFTAAFSAGNITGVQFHPEKSHRFGMLLLRNFVERV